MGCLKRRATIPLLNNNHDDNDTTTTTTTNHNNDDDNNSNDIIKATIDNILGRLKSRATAPSLKPPHQSYIAMCLTLLVSVYVCMYVCMYVGR